MSLLSKWKNKDKGNLLENQIGKAPNDALIPLSHGQKRLWFLNQLYPNNAFYNYTEYFVLQGNLELSALEESIEHVFSEQEVLCSFYPIENNQPILKISGETKVDIKKLDFSKIDKLERKAKIDTLFFEQSNTAFNLAQAPLYRISLIKTAADEHLLLLTFHHILVDRWSLDIFKQQLAACYKKLSSGGSISTSYMPLQYSDYAYWEHNFTDFENQKKYWKEILKDEIPTLNLQSDYKRPLNPTFKGRAHTQNLSRNLSTDVLNLAKELQVTPFVLFLSVYYLLLNKHTGQEDILVGSPISKRNEKSLENIMGFFIDTLVFRNKLDPAMSFTGHVEKTNAITLGAFSNKDVPFDILVKELKPDRSLMTNPFFQVMFIYSSGYETPDFGDGVSLLEYAEYDTQVAKFDLTQLINERDGLLSVTLEYSTELFEAKTIELFQNQLVLILEQIVKTPTIRLKDLSVLTSEEETFFFPTKERKEDLFPYSQTIYDLIEKKYETDKDKIAVVHDGEQLTYGDLKNRTEQVALAILQANVENDKVIGLSINRSVEMIIGLLGILKAGCAYLPIDPSYPKDRAEFMLQDSQAEILLTSSDLKEKNEFFKGTVLCIDDLQTNFNTVDFQFPVIAENDLAYIIYTSGSTGKPKGVPITHKNLMVSTVGRFEYYPKNPTAFLLMSSISFDSSKAGIYWTLASGGTLVIAQNRLEQDIDRMVSTIEDYRISHTLMLPSLYKMVLDYGSISNLKSLNTVMVAGEACNSSLVKSHFEKLPEVSLYNEYGPTEATVWCTAHLVQKSDADKTIPIGKPVANAEVYIVDVNLNLVPWGAVGEICIGGEGLTRGYLNRPDLDEKAFVTCAFPNQTKKRLYRTGDLGCFRKDGSIEFLGRKDQQIKIRGYRVELDEIEKVFLKHNKVSEVVVAVEQNQVSDELLVVEGNPSDSELNRMVSQFNNDQVIDDLLNTIISLTEEEKKYLLSELKTSNQLG